MIAKEAIQCLKKIKWYYSAGNPPGSYEYKRKQLEALDMAIDALKKEPS